MGKNKRKKKYLYKEVRWIPIYGRNFMILVTNSKKKAAKIDPIFLEGNFYASVCMSKTQKMPIIHFNFDHKTPITHAVVAHECLHIAHRTADTAGIEPDFYNDEALCYLLDWFVEDMYIMFEKWGFKPKKHY